MLIPRRIGCESRRNNTSQQQQVHAVQSEQEAEDSNTDIFNFYHRRALLTELIIQTLKSEALL